MTELHVEICAFPQAFIPFRPHDKEILFFIGPQQAPYRIKDPLLECSNALVQRILTTTEAEEMVIHMPTVTTEVFDAARNYLVWGDMRGEDYTIRHSKKVLLGVRQVARTLEIWSMNRAVNQILWKHHAGTFT